jgi:hypothetical protein
VESVRTLRMADSLCRRAANRLPWAKSLPSTKQLPLLATVTSWRCACRSTQSWPLGIAWAPKGGARDFSFTSLVGMLLT